MSVKVIEKNAGEKIPFTESGYKLNFDDMLAIKCNKYQKDWPVHKDICMDADGDLTMGTGDGLFYVAEVDIPAKEYEEQVTVTLWGLENPVAADDKEEE